VKKYIVIMDGKEDCMVMYSSALEQAKQYAVEALRGLPDGAQTSVYQHVTTAVQRDVLWKATPNGETVAPKVGKGRRPKGTTAARWTRSEDQQLLVNMRQYPDVTAGRLARNIKRLFPERTERAVAHRIRLLKLLASGKEKK
jgi:hypothetical protein